MSAAGRVQRAAGGGAGGPPAAGTHADRLHQQPEERPRGEGEEAGGEALQRGLPAPVWLDM